MKSSVYRNLYSKILTISNPRYEVNATYNYRTKRYSIAVYDRSNYELMTDYVPEYLSFEDVKHDLRTWINTLKKY